jgi:predicted transcriptional regulator
MFGFFNNKKEVRRIEEDVKASFDNIKKDFSKVGTWISHLDDKNKDNSKDIAQIKEQLGMIFEDLEEVKEAISLFGGRMSKHPQTSVYKQTASVDVQTPVQTAVQTTFLDNLTVSERSIVLALLYSDMKLSYEDLAVMLGKDKSTIRGQINAIKQKSESLIQEYTEPTGKKRVYIPEEIAKLISKSVKVRVKKKEKQEKDE